MKKIVSILLVNIMLFCLVSVVMAEDKAITFRGIEWYTTKQETEEKLFAEGAYSHGWLGSPNNIYKLSATDYENITMGSDRVDGGGFRGWYANVSVAGYDVEDTYACYLYPIKDGKIVHDDDLAELYFGWYSFGTGDYADHEGIFNDLNAKLSNLYGKGKRNNSKYNSTITWTDKKNNKIRLFINDDKDYVTLGYIAGDAEKRLNAMSKALQKEEKEKEREERQKNSNNNNGL